MFAQMLNYDPYRELNDLSRRLFGGVETRRVPTTAALPLDIREEPERFVVEADVPGLLPADLEIVVAPERLTIKGARKGATDAKDAKALHRERGSYSFERTLALPRGLDLEAVAAKLDNGVLTLTLPKRAADRPRTIPVTAVRAE
jgi:HSP20 family protein